MTWNSSVTTKLKVAYANLPPFVGVIETGEGIVFEGFIPEIFLSIAHWMNLEFTYIREPLDIYGDWKNNTWNGMVGMLFRNEVDLIMNPILPKEEFLEFMLFTNPITIEAYTILSGRESQDLGLFLYFGVLGKEVWLGIVIALVVIAATSAALFRNATMTRSFSWINTIGQYSWYLISSTMRQVSNEKLLLRKNPHLASIFLVLLIFFWVFGVGFVIMNSLQSLLVSKLTLKKTVPKVDTLTDLASKSGAMCIAPREIQIDHVLKDSNLAVNRAAWRKINHRVSHSAVFLQDSLKEVEKGKYCIIHGHLIIEDRLSTFFQRTGTCNMHISHKYFYPFSLLVAIHKKMPMSFYEKFNEGITRMVDADITGKWFKSSLRISNLCTSYSDTTLKPLSLQHIYGVLLLWISGLIVALIVLLCEMRLYKCSAKCGRIYREAK